MWFKKNKWKVILPVVIVLALAAAFYFGGSSPANRGWSVSAREEAAPQGENTAAEETAPEAAAPETEPPETEPAAAPEETPAAPPAEAEAEPSPAPVEEDPAPGEEAPVTEEPAPETEPETEPQAETEPAPEPEPTLPAGQEPEEEASSGHAAVETEAPQPLPAEDPPAPAEQEPAPEPEAPATVTLSVSCATVLGHMDWLDPDKTELIPADGWVLAPTELELTEGESVFDLLRRAARDSGLHLEYSEAPLYGTVYIEGIGNLYEMDCGGSSGWMYAVNGWFPNYGCSQYYPEAGDVIAFQYTCDLGDDIGGSNFG